MNTIHVLAPFVFKKWELIKAPINPLRAANILAGYLETASIAQWDIFSIKLKNETSKIFFN